MRRGSRPSNGGRLLLALSLLVLLCAAAWAVATPYSTAAADAAPECSAVADFDAGDFSNPTVIDNKFLPLVAGTRTVFEGRADRGAGAVAHTVIFTVTDVTKTIDGVRTVAVWDRDISEGVLVEEELAFFAQDDDGNVWSLGEYPEEHQDGVFVGAPSTWIAGIAEAEAGVHMMASPKRRSGWRLQGYAPSIDFFDCAKVFKTGQTACVPVGCFDDVLVMDEMSPPPAGNGHQRKYHARNVGIVQIGAVGDREGETLVLSERTMLGAGERLAARARALELDTRGYTVSPDVYGLTEPAS